MQYRWRNVKFRFFPFFCFGHFFNNFEGAHHVSSAFSYSHSFSHSINAYSSLSSFHFIHFFLSFSFSQQTYFPFTFHSFPLFLHFLPCLITFPFSFYFSATFPLHIFHYKFPSIVFCTTVKKERERYPPIVLWLYSWIHEMTAFITNTVIVIFRFVCKCKNSGGKDNSHHLWPSGQFVAQRDNPSQKSRSGPGPRNLGSGLWRNLRISLRPFSCFNNNPTRTWWN